MNYLQSQLARQGVHLRFWEWNDLSSNTFRVWRPPFRRPPTWRVRTETEMTPDEERAFEGIQAGMTAGMTFGNSAPDASPYADEGPYGTPVMHKKAGLTRRGKVAIAVAGVAIVGGGTIWFQVHSAAVAKDEKEAAALQIQMKKLELEEIRIRNEQARTDKRSPPSLPRRSRRPSTSA
ncbi:hypothetical protein NKH18_00440 [Streptomyces sp. M10(2022)]